MAEHYVCNETWCLNSCHYIYCVLESYHCMGEEKERRRDPGEPCRWLRLFSRCLYLGLCFSQLSSASQASCFMPVLVRLTAKAIRAWRLLGWSSRHLYMFACTQTHTQTSHTHSQTHTEQGSIKQTAALMDTNELTTNIIRVRRFLISSVFNLWVTTCVFWCVPLLEDVQREDHEGRTKNLY